MKKVTIETILSGEELALLRKTLTHFLKDPDYATGEEKGKSFQALSFGGPLPLEIVIRDWNTTINVFHVSTNGTAWEFWLRDILGE